MVVAGVGSWKRKSPGKPETEKSVDMVLLGGYGGVILEMR